MAVPHFNTNTLFYGDNLEILHKHFPDECVDLIYLDPPFNSKADYNILFKEATGEQSTAQIQAFSDFWHWDIEAMRAYDRLAMQSPKHVSDIIISMHDFLGKNDMFAYLVMMGERLLELHRVLKPTGSIYLHCDTTASHYLKLVLDAIFGAQNFRNEIIWQRFNFHADAHRYGRVHDILLFYTKTNDYYWKTQYGEHKEKYKNSHFTQVDPSNGRIFRLDNASAKGQGPPRYFNGRLLEPPIGTHWRWSQENIDNLIAKGKIVFTKTGRPAVKRYFDEAKPAIHSVWTDIPSINSMSKERVGFQTQKPLKLLERIIESSCPEDGLMLDPFCGCGTAIVAAEKLHRQWVGIDITFLAVNLVKGRLNDSFPTATFSVEGEPKDLGAARALAQNRYQFQWWALYKINARPVGSTEAKPTIGKKGADEGVDGWLRFTDKSEGHYEKIVVQVKSGHVGVKDIRELRDVVSRQKATMGIFLTLEEPTSEMVKEVKATEPYVSSLWNQEYSKIQILTIEQLLKGEQPKIPPTISQYQEVPRLKRVVKNRQRKL